MFKKVLGFMSYEDTESLEIGCVYKGKNDHYKLLEVKDKFILLQPVNGYSKTISQTYKSYLGV